MMMVSEGARDSGADGVGGMVRQVNHVPIIVVGATAAGAQGYAVFE